MTETFLQTAIAGAKRYAAANKSDPFTLARCMTHIRVGICHPYFDENGYRDDMIYDAQPATEMREVQLSSGLTMVPFEIFKNLRRP